MNSSVTDTSDEWWWFVRWHDN